MPLLTTSVGTYAAIAGGAAYVGPGDIVGSAVGWWGLRAYNVAYATGSNPAIDVVDAATGLTTTTINILANGSLDVATIAGLGYAVKVKKLYDQTGNGFHMTQATLATMPALVLSGLGSLPVMRFAGAQQLNVGTMLALAQPVTLSSAVKFLAAPGLQLYLHSQPGAADFLIVRPTSANTLQIFSGGNSGSATVSDDSFHALQAVFNGASGDINVDGSVNTVNTGAGATSFNNSFFLGAYMGSSGYLEGDVVETGRWDSAFTSGNSTSMSSNQHTYWGF